MIGKVDLDKLVDNKKFFNDVCLVNKCGVVWLVVV